MTTAQATDLRRGCPTCGEAFAPNRIGRPKRFCTDDCRRQMTHLRVELSALERELTESKTLQAHNFGNKSHYWRGHVRHLELAIAELRSRVTEADR